MRVFTKPRLAVLTLLLALGGGGYYWYSRQEAGPAAPGGAPGSGGPGGKMRSGFGNRPQPVSLGEVKIGDVRVWVNALGTAVPRNLVTVRARVDGELMRLAFREGEMVKQGQLLAEIDPRPFQVALAQANGQLQRDAALLQNAKLDLERYKALLAQDSIARQQVDTQEALVRQYEGTVAVDRGAVDNAKLQLGYTYIKSPASGRVGLRQVDPGNLVRASDPNGVAVVAQVQPMTVVFSVPETQLPALSRRVKGGQDVLVEAWDREQKNLLARGKLLASDNQVDTATGTLKLKAAFANKEDELFPNQFVNVRLLLNVLKEAVTIPASAIQRGARGPFVYKVSADNTVSVVPIKPGAIDGGTVAVEAELQAGDKLVTDGGDKLREGAKVEVIVANAKEGGERKGPRGDGKGGWPGRGERKAEGQGAAEAKGAPPAPAK